MVCFAGLTVACTMANILMVSSMVREPTHLQMAFAREEFGKKAREFRGFEEISGNTF